MHDVLLNLMSHMRWADALVADALERHMPADAEPARLFAHIASVEHLWYSRIHGERPLLAVWPSLTVGEARTLAAQHADRFVRLVEAADADALNRSVDYRNSAGRSFRSSVADMVTQTAMHGSHHRGQILRLLRAGGHEPPLVDYIQFARRDQK
jgi:uncharacterized damage-inducible protein DinB